MSLLHELTRTVRAPAALPPIEPLAYAPPEAAPATPPAPLTTIEIGRHHASGGFLATFAGDKAIGTTRLEALGQLVRQGAFGRLHILDRT